MTRLINHYPIKTVIEVGTWMGGSTRHIAELLPEDGIVYGIDTFAGSKAEKNAAQPDSITDTLYD
jgi:predicted O-methyltransferase YrrM